MGEILSIEEWERTVFAGGINELTAAARTLRLHDRALRRERDAAQTASFVQVGWLGPYGLIPGGMDNDPDPKWRPVYVQSLSAPKEGPE